MTRVDRMMFQKPGDKPVASIPAREDYDTDLVLSDAIHELFQLREKLARHHAPHHMCFTCWVLDHPGEAQRIIDELIQPADAETDRSDGIVRGPFKPSARS